MSVLTDLRQLRGEVGEVLARHEQAQSVTDFAKYASDPAGFMRDVLRCEPWAKQIEMAECVRDHGRTVVVTGNGLGKDWLTARVALWWAFACRGMVILTGPTERQVKQILMREIRRAFAVAPELPGELYAMELRIDGSSGILAFTSDNADRLTGFHHPRLLICVTEGQGVEEEAYEAALACVTGPENRLFVYGNPTQPAGAFYRAATSDHWHTLTVRATEHPNIITGRDEIPGAVSRGWIETMRDEYGETSPIYRSRVLAEFPDSSVEGLISREWINAAFDRYDAGELEAKARLRPTLLALDVARYGPDSSVLAHVDGPIVRPLVTWRGACITETVARVIAFGQEIGTRRACNPTVHVDEPGLGGGAVDLLRQKRYPTVAFNGAGQAVDDRFLNARAESHWALRSLLENGEVAIARDEALAEELLSIDWQINPAGKIQIVGKDAIRKTLGHSPDRADAVVIGLAYSTGALRRRTMSVGTFTIG